MKKLLALALAAVALASITWVSISWGTSNLNLSKSNVNRVHGVPIVTATIDLTGPNQTQTVFTTPAVGDFVLTQFCTSVMNGGMRLAVTGFGSIAHTSTDSCITFTPGISVPKNAAITCSTTSGPRFGEYFCMISGLCADCSSPGALP